MYIYLFIYLFIYIKREINSSGVYKQSKEIKNSKGVQLNNKKIIHQIINIIIIIIINIIIINIIIINIIIVNIIIIIIIIIVIILLINNHTN